MREPDLTKPHQGTFTHWRAVPCLKYYGMGFLLAGKFHGHPIFGNERGHTSEVVAVFPELNMVETKNSRYTLEHPSVNDGAFPAEDDCNAEV